MDALEPEAWEETPVGAGILRYLALFTYPHSQGQLFHSCNFMLATNGIANPRERSEQIGRLREARHPDPPEITAELCDLSPDFFEFTGDYLDRLGQIQGSCSLARCPGLRHAVVSSLVVR